MIARGSHDLLPPSSYSSVRRTPWGSCTFCMSWPREMRNSTTCTVRWWTAGMVHSPFNPRAPSYHCLPPPPPPQHSSPTFPLPSIPPPSPLLPLSILLSSSPSLHPIIPPFSLLTPSSHHSSSTLLSLHPSFLRILLHSHHPTIPPSFSPLHLPFLPFSSLLSPPPQSLHSIHPGEGARYLCRGWREEALVSSCICILSMCMCEMNNTDNSHQGKLLPKLLSNIEEKVLLVISLKPCPQTNGAWN